MKKINIYTYNDRNRPKYPVYYNGKEYYEDDCGDIFLAVYHNRYCLTDENSVYLGSKSYVFPDDTMNIG